MVLESLIIAGFAMKFYRGLTPISPISISVNGEGKWALRF